MTKFTLQNVIFKTFILLKNNVKFSKINVNKCKNVLDADEKQWYDKSASE